MLEKAETEILIVKFSARWLCEHVGQQDAADCAGVAEHHLLRSCSAGGRSAGRSQVQITEYGTRDVQCCVIPSVPEP